LLHCDLEVVGDIADVDCDYFGSFIDLLEFLMAYLESITFLLFEIEFFDTSHSSETFFYIFNRP